MTETFSWAGAWLHDSLPLSSGHGTPLPQFQGTCCPRPMGLVIGSVWGPMEAVQAPRPHLCGLC